MEAKGSGGTLLHNAVIVTVDSQSRVFRNGGIFVLRDKIAGIGHAEDILGEFSRLAKEIIDLKGCLLIPG